MHWHGTILARNLFSEDVLTWHCSRKKFIWQRRVDVAFFLRESFHWSWRAGHVFPERIGSWYNQLTQDSWGPFLFFFLLSKFIPSSNCYFLSLQACSWHNLKWVSFARWPMNLSLVSGFGAFDFSIWGKKLYASIMGREILRHYPIKSLWLYRRLAIACILGWVDEGRIHWHGGL